MIYVTHDQIEAMSMADRIAVMYCGQLYQWGSPDDVYNRPVNTFVARFIGSPNMNFIDCSYEVENGQGFLAQKKGGLRVPVDAKRRRLLEDRTGPNSLILGIRPEHMKVYDEAAPNAAVAGHVVCDRTAGPDDHCSHRSRRRSRADQGSRAVTGRGPVIPSGSPLTWSTCISLTAKPNRSSGRAGGRCGEPETRKRNQALRPDHGR